MKYAVNMTPEQVLAATVDSIEYVKKHGVICEFSPMDATRSELPFLKQVCKAAQDAGMDSLNVPDTVGIMIPKTTIKLIEDLKTVVTVPISIHCHDDFGMAVANSLAAVEAGAAQVHVHRQRLRRTSRQRFTRRSRYGAAHDLQVQNKRQHSLALQHFPNGCIVNRHYRAS